VPQPAVRAFVAASFLYPSAEIPLTAAELARPNRDARGHDPRAGASAPRRWMLSQRPSVAMLLALVLPFLATTLLIGTFRAAAQSSPDGTTTIQHAPTLTQTPPPEHTPGAHRDVAINR
jgi:hypothetical protein